MEQQSLGCKIHYKKMGPGGVSLNNPQEVIEYFDHLLNTAREQWSGEGDKKSLSVIDVRMDKDDLTCMLDSFDKVNIQYKLVERKVKMVDPMSDELKEVKLTELNLEGYKIRIR